MSADFHFVDGIFRRAAEYPELVSAGRIRLAERKVATLPPGPAADAWRAVLRAPGDDEAARRAWMAEARDA